MVYSCLYFFLSDITRRQSNCAYVILRSELLGRRSRTGQKRQEIYPCKLPSAPALGCAGKLVKHTLTSKAFNFFGENLDALLGGWQRKGQDMIAAAGNGIIYHPWDIYGGVLEYMGLISEPVKAV